MKSSQKSSVEFTDMITYHLVIRSQNYTCRTTIWHFSVMTLKLRVPLSDSCATQVTRNFSPRTLFPYTGPSDTRRTSLHARSRVCTTLLCFCRTSWSSSTWRPAIPCRGTWSLSGRIRVGHRTAACSSKRSASIKCRSEPLSDSVLGQRSVASSSARQKMISKLVSTHVSHSDVLWRENHSHYE